MCWGVGSGEGRSRYLPGIVLPDTIKEKPQRGTIIAVGQGRRGLLRLLPVALEDHVGAREHLAGLREVEGAAEGRLPRSHELGGTILRRQVVPLRPGAVDRQER